VNGIDSIEPLPMPFMELLTERLRLYFVTGGMPEVVADWFDRSDTEKMERIMSGILASYEIDFSKHLSPSMTRRAARVWNTLPSQMSKENRKFQYKVVKEGANARDYEEAIDWLCRVSLMYRVIRCRAPGLPIVAYDDDGSFKLYAADVGLIRALSKLDASAVTEGDRLFTEFKGALSENYVLNALAMRYDTPIRYWTTYHPSYEVDFLLQHGNHIIPVEVKAGLSNKGKGLAVYGERYADKTPLRVRYSLLNLDLSGDLLNIPLFLADRTPELVDLALKSVRH
jgi:predicted AAA+ superfamily ATPase